MKKIVRIDTDGTIHWLETVCDKCGGTGVLDELKLYNSGKCYKCNGSGYFETRWTEAPKHERAKPNYYNYNSQYVGVIGERIELRLTRMISFKTKYYTQRQKALQTYIHKFSDADGNVFIWQTVNKMLQNRHAIKECVLDGEIKCHRTYKNEKQTVLTRCNVREVLFVE